MCGSMWVRVLAASLLPLFAVALSVVSPNPAVAKGTDAQPGSSAFDDQALQIVSAITESRFADVREQFDPTMAEQLSEEAIANAWRTFQEAFGSFQSVGQPAAEMLGELTMERVPVQMASSGGEIRITFHPDGTIAGLFFLRPSVPIP